MGYDADLYIFDIEKYRSQVLPAFENYRQTGQRDSWLKIYYEEYISEYGPIRPIEVNESCEVCGTKIFDKAFGEFVVEKNCFRTFAYVGE